MPHICICELGHHQVMACHPFGAKPLPEPALAYCQLDSWEQMSVKFEPEFYHFHSRKFIWKCQLPKWRPFCPGGDELIGLLSDEECAVLMKYSTQFSLSSLCFHGLFSWNHYNGVIMGMIASQITSLTIVYSTVYSDADQRKYQSSASLAFVRGIHRRPVNSPHKWPVTRKMFPFDDIMKTLNSTSDGLLPVTHPEWYFNEILFKISLKCTKWKCPVQNIGCFVQSLTHLPLVSHICVSESGQHWFR